MNQIIPLSTSSLDNQQVQTVNARDLHGFLEVKSNYRDWIRNRIADFGFVENQDFVSFAKNLAKPNGGRPSTEYHLTLGMAKELCMVERNAKGKQARLYFIECERVAREAQNALALPNFTDPAQAARAWAIEYEQRQAAENKALQLTRQIEADKPKVDLAETFLDTTGAYLIRVVAKAVGMKPKKLYAWMREKGLMNANNEAYARFTERGILRTVPSFYDANGERRCSLTTRITAKGVNYIHEKLIKDGLIDPQKRIDFAHLAEV